MPVDFLTDEQKQHYGCSIGGPSSEQLACYFHLSDSDRQVIAEHRGVHNRLGFALQLTTLRFLGLFLGDPLAVPVGAVTYVASQIGITDLAELPRYAERIQTQWDHQAEIRRRFGYYEGVPTFLPPVFPPLSLNSLNPLSMRIQRRLQKDLSERGWTRRKRGA